MKKQNKRFPLILRIALFFILPYDDLNNLAGVLSLLITFLTVSYQSIKASLVNPTESLRTE